MEEGKNVGKAQKKNTRKISYNNMKLFFAENKRIDAVAYCEPFGGAIYCNIPYEVESSTYIDEDILELTLCWTEAEPIEYVFGAIPVCKFPTMPFSTKYTAFKNGGSRYQLFFDTGGGFRNMIHIYLFTHNDDPEHMKDMKKLLQEFRR